MDKGVLYGIGVGPGDPELLTLKAIKILKAVDIIAVPKSKSDKDSVALNIVKDYIDNKPIIELVFPMIFDKEKLNSDWNKAADLVTTYLANNQNVAFITLGDPTIYSTFIYLNKLVINKGYKTLIIPGIPSFCACSAEAMISLAENNESISIIPSASNMNELITKINEFDTVILMKFRKNFNQIKDIVSENKSIHAIIVENCTMNSQKIYRDIQKIHEADLSYFSTMIITKRVI